MDVVIWCHWVRIIWSQHLWLHHSIFIGFSFSVAYIQQFSKSHPIRSDYPPSCIIQKIVNFSLRPNFTHQILTAHQKIPSRDFFSLFFHLSLSFSLFIHVVFYVIRKHTNTLRIHQCMRFHSSFFIALVCCCCFCWIFVFVIIA